MPATILILGAAGLTGRTLTPLLLAHTDARLVLAGRDASALAGAATALGDPDRVTTRRVDAMGAASGLACAFAGVDLVVCVAPVTRGLPEVVRIAATAGADTLDIQFSPTKLAGLRAMEPTLAGAGRTAITDGGFHPGLPAVLARAVEERFDRLRSARVASIIQEDWRRLAVRPETAREFVEFITDMRPAHLRDGRWTVERATSSQATPEFDFGPPFGRRRCYAMGLEEMRIWAEGKSDLVHAGFYVGGFNPVVDHLVLPVVLLGRGLASDRSLGPLATLLFWGLRTFGRAPYGTVVRLEADGERDGRPLRVVLSVSHRDTYALTAIPVAATVLQWLRGQVTGPGVRLQALAVEPATFLDDLRMLGATVDEQVTSLGTPVEATSGSVASGVT